MPSSALARWHDLARTKNAAGLDGLIAEDAVFHSPVVHAPQRGKRLTIMYLTAALELLCNGSFRYVREIVNDDSAVLEFETEIDGILINGVDMITWDGDGRIIDFKVMLRPLKAINLVHQKMGELLQARSAPTTR
jgi:hypothetical protein